MSVSSKLFPMETGTCVVEITIMLDQLRQDAKDLIADMIAVGISQAGLHFEDFVPVVLRRRMENLVTEGQRLGFKPRRGTLVFDDDPSEEGPCIMLWFATEDDAVLFRSLIL